MNFLLSLLRSLIETVGWGLTLSGGGIALIGLLYAWGERSRRLVLVILGCLMLIVGQMLVAFQQGGWRLAVLSGFVFGLVATAAILGQVVQSYFVEPVAKRILAKSEDPGSRWLRKWLREPGHERIKRLLFPFSGKKGGDLSK